MINRMGFNNHGSAALAARLARSTRARQRPIIGANIGKVAAARKLLTLVYYGLRDGHIRCLARPA